MVESLHGWFYPPVLNDFQSFLDDGQLIASQGCGFG
jgi:hypothetical protein